VSAGAETAHLHLFDIFSLRVRIGVEFGQTVNPVWRHVVEIPGEPGAGTLYYGVGNELWIDTTQLDGTAL
jgi:hypothetical protein